MNIQIQMNERRKNRIDVLNRYALRVARYCYFSEICDNDEHIVLSTEKVLIERSKMQLKSALMKQYGIIKCEETKNTITDLIKIIAKNQSIHMVSDEIESANVYKRIESFDMSELFVE